MDIKRSSHSASSLKLINVQTAQDLKKCEEELQDLLASCAVLQIEMSTLIKPDIILQLGSLQREINSDHEKIQAEVNKET